MRPATLLRYAFALAFVLAGTGWLTTANAQSFTATSPDGPSLSYQARGLETLIDQSDDFTSGLVSQVNIDTPDFDIINGDDFTIPEGVTWTVQQVFADGFYSLSPNPNPAGDPLCTAADIAFWTNGDSEPGTQLFSYEGVAPATDDAGALTFEIDDTELESGTYWLTVQCEGDLNFDTEDTATDGDPVDIRRWNWFRNDDNDATDGAGNSGAARNDNGGFGFPEAGWNPLTALATAGFDYNFVLSGFSEGDALLPELALSPDMLTFDVPSGGSDTETLTISNEGDGDLTFSFPGFVAERRIAELLSRGVDVNSHRFDTSVDLPKGTEPRVYERAQSTMAQYRVAGPDNFGYVAIDSDEEGGPTYDFMDIATTGTEIDESTAEALGCSLGAGGDEGYFLVDLPFTFEFYGVAYDQVYVNTNGHLNFNDFKGDPGCGFTNDAIPDTGLPNGGLIAPLWDDFDLRDNTDQSDGGQIYYETVDVDGDQVFVVQFNEIEKFANNGDLNTFEVLLYPNGTIKYQYGDLQSTTLSATIGVERNDGTDGLQVSMNEDYAAEGLAVLITQSGQYITNVDPANGTVTPGMSQDVMVTVDASAPTFGGGLPDGSYNDILVLNTNDEDESTVLIPAEIEVGGGSGGDIFPEDFEDTAVGELPDGWVSLSNGVGDGETDQQDWEVIDDTDLGKVAQNRFQNVDGDNDCDAAPETCAQDYLVTPQFDVEMGTTLTFDAAEAFGGFDFGSTYAVLISTASQTTIGDFTVLESYTEEDFPGADEGAMTFTIDLSAFAGESAYIAFLHTNDDGDNFLLDNVDVTNEGGGEMTIAEARAAGAGATVTVTGTVTRAMGDFTYFQDETAGLTVRQPEGDFFDDVADGTISEGTEITVTGTLSEFANLLQINEDDLTSYTVGADGEVPAPQMVTLTDIVDNGEDFEAELVEVTDLATDSTGTFEAGTSYTVTDPTASDTLRVPNAGDSDIDGTMIPEGEFTFTGVVGQFSFDGPNLGYQLLAIEEGDVEAEGPGGALEFDPSPLVEMLAAGQTGDETVTITNNTDSDVMFDFVQYSGEEREMAPATSGEPSLDLQKGATDPRGYAQRFGSGGPDAFGYEWIDSNEPGGPAFETIDISETGTELVAADFDPEGCSFDPLDEGNALVDLPFTFSFYGDDYTSLKVNINGNLNFNADGAELPCAFTNDPLPDPGDPNGGLIAPLWDDYDASPEGAGGGQIFYETLADGRFVVQYDGIEKFANDTEANTFQVILSPSGAIKYQYVDLNSSAFTYSIGIENPDGTVGLEVAMGSTYAENGLAVLIQARPSFVTDVDPATGTIPAGGTADVDVTFDANGLNAGTYEGVLNVDTDLESDPSMFELPVQLIVSGMAECGLTADTITFDDTIIGNSSSEEATVMNGGTDSCELTDASADGPFSVEDFEAGTLAPGASTTFTVVYTPTDAGDDTGTLTVTLAGKDDLTAALEGSAFDPPTPEVDPDELSFTVTMGETDSGSFTLSNVGGGDAADLEYSITIAEDAGRPALTAQAPQARTSSAQRSKAASSRLGQSVLRRGSESTLHRGGEASMGRAPARTQSAPTGSPTQRGGESSIGYGVDATATTNTFVSLDFQTPAVVTPINPVQGTVFYGAGALGSTDDIAYQVAGTTLFEVDTETGVETAVGDLGTELSGMTYDPTTGTYYGINFTQPPTGAVLFEIDVETATATSIGTGSFSTAIALASTPDGELYSYDIANDVLVQVDKATGASTVIGPIGFDANFGQGMTYDYVNDVMTMAAFNSGAGQPELRTVDLSTGNTTLVGVLGASQIGWVGASSAAGITLIAVSPESGTIAPGDSDEITVSVDATGVDPGTYEFDVNIATNDPNTPLLVVDVTVVVEPVKPANEDDAVPTEFALDQNYPNPFASRTTVEYALPEAAHVTITVYDAVGRRVAVLVDEDLTTGYHKAEWDTRGLASGVYLYRIEAGDYVKTKKMSLVR